MPKDLFSAQSNTYARYRPTYPAELFEYITSFTEEKKHAWDCATGNGQAAVALSEYFEKVDATDISEAQIRNAIPKSNIEYHVCPAEHTPFPDNRFDLITVAQAYHWIHWKKFFDEATRTGKPGAIVAVWGYNLMSSENEKLNQLIDYFYYEVTAPYWDPERKYVDDAYATTEFDFSPLPAKDFSMEMKWSKEQFTGYLESWSAVQNYINKNKKSPLSLVQSDIDLIWREGESQIVHFPIFMKLGRVVK